MLQKDTSRNKNNATEPNLTEIKNAHTIGSKEPQNSFQIYA